MGRTGGSYTTGSEDIFAVNPLKRSAIIAGCGWAFLLVPLMLPDNHVSSVLLISFGWLAAVAVIFVTPILIWSLAEVIWDAIRQRRNPTIHQLDLSPRARHLLLRFGYDTIESIESAQDSQLLLLSNMDARTVREIRRAVSIWRYQRWQAQGFPAHDMP